MAILEPNRLIKASAARSVVEGAAFNFDDLRRQCDDLVDKAHSQARAILAEAKRAADELRAQARAEGLGEGREQGLAAAHELIEVRAAEIASARTQEQLRSVLPAFHAAVRALELERDQWLLTWETAAIRLSAEIAGKVLGQELSRQPEIAVSMIREALQLAIGQPEVKLHVNPLDLEQLQNCGKEAVARLEAVGRAELVGDDRVARGGCLIETQHGRIDARIETQLDRITSELLENC